MDAYPYAMKDYSDPKTLNYHDMLRETDLKDFMTAMQKEWYDQLENDNFTIIKKIISFQKAELVFHPFGTLIERGKLKQ